MIKVAVIIGSTRPKRFADKVTPWLVAGAEGRNELNLEVLDLRDHPLPFMSEPVPPSRSGGKYENPGVAAWGSLISQFDAFIATVAEYNHGPTAVLKNALDSAYVEWSRKPIAFVGYGSVGGARAIEQLRGTAIELDMVPIRAEVNIARDAYIGVLTQGRSLDSYEHLNANRTVLFDQVTWWGEALRNARRATHGK